ncbi:MAG: SPASM domain-containing protein [Chitinophagaceae bacterium]|nr:SPASM domain-containing protein [Chitinophagaceae bacterium]
MMKRSIPINKGNYSLDTSMRDNFFNKNRAHGVETEYARNRREWEDFPRLFHVADYPLLVDLELSSICNLKCPFCYTLSEGFKEQVDATLMDFELFSKVIDEIGDKVFAIRLSLRGEPTIHPRFIDAIHYAKSKGIKEVSTLTNASMLTPEFFTEAMEAGIDWITVSFDGLNDEYERNRYPLKFDTIYGHLQQALEIREKSGRVKPVIKVQTVWPAIEKDPLAYYEAMVKVSDLVAFNPLIDFANPKPFEQIEFEENFVCPQLYQRMVIAADGRVLLCANDEQSEHVIGNSRHQTIHEIWHGQELAVVRKQHLQRGGFRSVEICRKCFLPRKTRDDLFSCGDRPLIVQNYR